MKILVTGGCGFVGSHLVDRLVEKGHEVSVYDILEPQVHGNKKPSCLNKHASYTYGDIRDAVKFKRSLKGIEIIFHEASQVGVGQSMYEIKRYVSHNSYGTAVLLDLLVNDARHKVKKLIVASSMSIYGEGAYECRRCGKVYPRLRKKEQMASGDWDMKCPICGINVKSIPTDEMKPLFPTSVYATTKRCQEEMCIQIGTAYKIPTVALRYFNIFGPRQSLSNPYTGVAAIFMSRIKNSKPPVIFEDGKQSRDFIYVSDIVDANILAMGKKEANYECFNVGTGIPHSILEIAQKISASYNENLVPRVLNKFRAGDIRHCYADIGKIRKKLGFSPKVSFEEGIKRLIKWSDSQIAVDLTKAAHSQLKKKGLA